MILFQHLKTQLMNRKSRNRLKQLLQKTKQKLKNNQDRIEALYKRRDDIMDAANIVVIVVALIGAIGTIISNIVSNNKHANEMDAKLDKQQAITETKLDALTNEVKRHNNFAEQIPEIRSDIKNLEKRVDKLESKTDKAS